MKNKILIFLLVCIMYISNNGNYTLAQKNMDIFNDILIAAKGQIVEYGIRANYEIKEEPENYCLKVIRALGVNLGDICIKKGEEFYSVEFSKNMLKGYIECSSYDNHNVVTFNIIKTDNENKLSQFKDEIDSIIGGNYINIKYFQYLKARLPEIKLASVNNNLIEMMKNKNIKNIETIELQNGYSTIAYTGLYNTMKSNGKLMDLNYAVCSYTSGNYIIIGTPTIIESY